MHEAAAREFYAAIDEGDYDRLATLLTPAFVHERPDRTLSGRDTFVSFMRDDRPLTETSHEISAVYAGESEVAVRGTLRSATGESLLKFVDVHELSDDRIERITTYTTQTAAQLTES
ncbi:nuclear transport factor 2 family protein [Haladaptatus sp. GCM10025707]|uniref:nuclear transport factor 2 family protein n=1 Tax=unclassified Haladaptatus TaxID=2622732 RepID=UPI0023E86596|nr:MULTISPECIES: nuclear transport factor 2 family protein [unclassified Haladaptatus]